MIRIISTGDKADGTLIETQDGSLITGVTSIHIEILPYSVVIATLSIHTQAVDIEAHPLLTLPTLRAAAAHYGFELRPLPSEPASH